MVIDSASICNHALLGSAVLGGIPRIQFGIMTSRVDAIQADLLRLIKHFEVPAQAMSISFDDVWEQSVELVVADARFVLLCDMQESRMLDDAWRILLGRVIRRMEDRDLTLNYSVDQRAIDEFIARQSSAREKIHQTSQRMFTVLLVDVSKYLMRSQIDLAFEAVEFVHNELEHLVLALRPQTKLAVART